MMKVTDARELAVNSKKDLVKARRDIVAIAQNISMNSMKETELRTAATELLVNMVRYGGGGVVKIEKVEHEGVFGVRASFEDQGPGIADLETAMRKGFSTGKSLGHGLSGCKNLVDWFDIQSETGKGTRVVITKWK